MKHKWVEPMLSPVDLDGSTALYLTLECADCDAIRTVGPANTPDGLPNANGPMITTTATRQRTATRKERAQALAAWVMRGSANKTKTRKVSNLEEA